VKILRDTNILLRPSNRRTPELAAITESLDTLIAQGHGRCICAQSVAELWATLTRPLAANGFGFEPAEARRRIEILLGSLTFIPDPPTLFSSWLALYTSHRVRGRQVYDARLVALMTASGITKFARLNSQDFARYAELELIVPRT